MRLVGGDERAEGGEQGFGGLELGQVASVGDQHEAGPRDGGGDEFDRVSALAWASALRPSSSASGGGPPPGGADGGVPVDPSSWSGKCSPDGVQRLLILVLYEP